MRAARIFAITALLIWAVNAHSSEPVLGSLVFEQTWYDFGEVAVGAQLTHRFPFKVISGPVNIGVIFTGCGCTTVGLDKKQYLAGEKGEIIATVDTTEFNGIIYKEINIELINATEKNIDLAIIAKVKR